MHSGCCSARWAVSGLLLLGASASADKGSTGWMEVRTEHVTLKTDLSPEQARRAALAVERTRAALLAAAWGGAKLQAEPIEVVVFANQQDFLRYFGRNITGLFTHGEFPPTAFLYGPPDKWERRATLALEETTSVLKHELVHHLAAFVYRRQPRWFAEGLAQYLETLRISEDEKTATLGEVNLQALAAYRAFRVSIADVFAWGGKFDAQDETKTAGLYGKSWLLVHWLNNVHPEEFAKYQTLLQKGIDPDKAWKVAFPSLTNDDIEVQLHQYVDHGDYHYFVVPIASVGAISKERPLLSADVHAIRAKAALTGGNTLVDGSTQLADGQAELAAALADDPANVRASLMKLPLVKPEERPVLGRRATEAHPDDGLAWLLLADSLQGVPGGWDEQTQAYQKAIALLPDNPLAFNNLAWMYLQKGRAQEALPLAVSAVRLAPWESSMLYTLASALASVGRCSEALSVQTRAVDLLPETTSTKARAQYTARLTDFQKTCAQTQTAAPPAVAPATPPAVPTH
jgi:tetratricopeptide (TPR) repeat protein